MSFLKRIVYVIVLLPLLTGCPDKGTNGGGWHVIERIGSFGMDKLQFDEPCGIRVEWAPVPFGVSIFVADYGNDRIQIISLNPNYDTVIAIGEEGNDLGQFNGPIDIAVTRINPLDINRPPPENLNIYVADSKNHRIQKFDFFGSFITSWGSFGTDTGQFNTPIGIDVDYDENVYVVDSGNHRIQVFDSIGVFKMMWGHFGEENSQFNTPMDITTLNNLANNTLFGTAVSDYGNNRIQIFDQNGDFMKKINNIPEPKGISGIELGFDVVSGKKIYSYYLPTDHLSYKWITEMKSPYDNYDGHYITDRENHQIYWYENTNTY